MYEHLKRKRQMWTVPTGRGKQRICAALAICMARRKKMDRIVAVFANDFMMENEKPFYDNVAKLLGDI